MCAEITGGLTGIVTIESWVSGLTIVALNATRSAASAGPASPTAATAAAAAAVPATSRRFRRLMPGLVVSLISRSPRFHGREQRSPHVLLPWGTAHIETFN